MGFHSRTVKDIEDTDALDEYWEAHRVDDSEAQGLNSPDDEGTSKQVNGRRKARTLSDAAALGHDPHTLSNDHPAISLRRHLDLFGPLLFPLYRAALLRKRILVLTHPPVREACDLVYNLSVISNIPSQLAHILPESEALSPVRPLFNVGVHDIAYLSELSKRNTRRSYLACSTDEILATKQNLYDVLVELPQQSDAETEGKQWPKLRTAEGDQIKATQRDMRRYRALRKELQRIEHSTQGRYHDVDDEDEQEENEDDESETAPLTHAARPSWEEEDEYSVEGETSVVEPTSWTAMAYTGFFWWASAGEKDAWLEDERSRDSSLLSDLPLPEASSSRPASMKGSRKNVSIDDDEGEGADRNDGSKAEAQALAMVLIAFVHRLTRLTLESMAELVESADDETETENDDTEQGAVGIDSEDLRRMGLDVWSETDKEFARELLQLYFGRAAEVRGQGVECCGIKIC